MTSGCKVSDASKCYFIFDCVQNKNVRLSCVCTISLTKLSRRSTVCCYLKVGPVKMAHYGIVALVNFFIAVENVKVCSSVCKCLSAGERLMIQRQPVVVIAT